MVYLYNYCGCGHYPFSCFYLNEATFWRLDSFPVLRWYLHSWAQSIELVSISGHQHQHKVGYIKQAVAGAGVRRWGLALSNGPNWVGSIWGRRISPVSETLCVSNKNRTMDNVQNLHGKADKMRGNMKNISCADCVNWIKPTHCRVQRISFISLKL
jgi:hypothetical protein